MRRQDVTAPSGERWQIGRRWLEKEPPKPWSRRRRRERDEGGDGSGWGGAGDLVGGVGDDLVVGIAIVLALAAVVLLFTFVVVPLLGLALELVLLIGVLVGSLFGRVVLGHPWTIEAVNVDRPEQRVRFAVKGWRRSRRTIDALAEAIRTTGPPSALPEATPVAAGFTGDEEARIHG